MASQLRDRGHEVIVLTSQQPHDDEINDPSWVRRELHMEMALVSLRNGIQFFTHRQQHERENLAVMQSYIRRFRCHGDLGHVEHCSLCTDSGRAGSITGRITCTT